MKKTLHFLSGIPRSGSTVLAAILNQNPLTHVSTTSGLVHALDGLANTWYDTGLLNENDQQRILLAQTMRGLIDAFYEHTDKPVIIDKSRGWPIPIIMNAMTQVLQRKPRIIATVRSVPDCMASFVRIAQPADLDDFMATGQLADHLKASYISLQEGFVYDRECFLMVEYDDLVGNPRLALEKIHDFLELPAFDYDLSNIDGTSVKEDDENLHGYSGMHEIAPQLARQHEQHPRDQLLHHYPAFCQPEFWLEKPRTVPELHDLDLQLAASTMGDFDEGWRLAQKLEREEPNNYRAAYNRGWYYLRKGEIQTGYKLMDMGRRVGVFGNKHPETVTPLWDGKARGTILLYLEGGLGDQIHQVRYAQAIAQRGNKVVISCTGQLVPLLNEVQSVNAAVQHGAEYGVYHDFWVPGMSAIVPLGWELQDISGAAYIDKPLTIRGKRKRIGLRWQGNKQFEDQHHKLFPAELMFDAVKNVNAEFVSLQRDDGAELCPPWVRRVPLESWHQTREAIAGCDLVISSCTSVAHMSGAMGVETWVVTPVMPYFLWAMAGERTPYYDSIRLFRQETFGDWTAPFAEIGARLERDWGLNAITQPLKIGA
jgi:Sulfotransferase family